MSRDAPSVWVRRFAPLIRPGGRVLDVAAGNGRHTALLLDLGFSVVAVDRRTEGLRDLNGERCIVQALDLEAASPDDPLAPLGAGFDGIVVTNYLHRPLFRWLVAALAPGGVLLYETFAEGNERFGHPRNPAFLLRTGELLEAFPGLTIVAFEQGEVTQPVPGVRQRLAAIAGPLGHLPPA